MQTATMTLRERFEDAMKFVDATGLPPERFTITISDYAHDVQLHPLGDYENDCRAAAVRLLGPPSEIRRDTERGVDWLIWPTSYDSTRLRVVMGVKVK